MVNLRRMLITAMLVTLSVAAGAGTAHAATTGPRLSYWGGHVVRNVRVVAAVWGSGRFPTGVTSTTAPNINSFFSAVTRSSYVDWLAEYNTPTERIGRGSFGGRSLLHPSTRNNGTHIDDVANIRPELLAQMRAGHLPRPDANTVYALYFRAGQIVTQGHNDSVSGFCAYHSTVRARDLPPVRYMVLPATAAGTHCGHAPGFANLTSATSHELLEAVTDPDVGLATRVGPPLAWYDPFHGEIADICAGLTVPLRGADGHSYVVQRGWSNRRRSCVAS